MRDRGRTVQLDGPELSWQSLTLPDSEPAIRRFVLHAEGQYGASVQAVEFPPQWRRPGAGHYAADEEFVVLRGWLKLSGVVVRAGDYAVIPRGALRTDSYAGLEGCLAVAWFSSAPRWQPGAATPSAGAVSRRPLDGVLVSAGGHLLADAVYGLVAGPADILAVDGRWTWVPEGARLAAPAGPALVRLWRQSELREAGRLP